MVLSKELEAILELRRRKSDENRNDVVADLTSSPDGNSVPAAMTPRGIDKELELKLELRRHKSCDASFNDDRSSNNNKDATNAGLDNSTHSSGRSSHSAFSTASASAKKTRSQTLAMRRLYHGVEVTSSQQQQQQPASLNAFPFPRSSPRAPSPPNTNHDLSTSSSDRNYNTSNFSSSSRPSSSKSSPMQLLTLKERIRAATISKRQDRLTADNYNGNNLSPYNLSQRNQVAQHDEKYKIKSIESQYGSQQEKSTDEQIVFQHESQRQDRAGTTSWNDSYPIVSSQSADSSNKNGREAQSVDPFFNENTDFARTSQVNLFSNDDFFAAFPQDETISDLQQEKEDPLFSFSFDDDSTGSHGEEEGSYMDNQQIPSTNSSNFPTTQLEEGFFQATDKIDFIQQLATLQTHDEQTEQEAFSTTTEDEEDSYLNIAEEEKSETVSRLGGKEQNPHNAPAKEEQIQRKVVLQSEPFPYRCKQATKAVINSATGNFIVCRELQGKYFLEEVDPIQGNVVLSTCISTEELQRKASSLGLQAEIIHEITAVKAIASGAHRSIDGRTRVKVSAIIDLMTLTSSNASATTTILAVWQWGYGSGKPVSLQSVLPPPQKSSVVGLATQKNITYSPETLCYADGLLFLGGSCCNAQTHAPFATACVYVAKPHIRGVWSCSFVAESSNTDSDFRLFNRHQEYPSSEVTALAVTCQPKHSHKFLAIATSLGSLSVWIYYSTSTTNRADSKNRNILEPLYLLHGAEVLRSCEETLFDTHERDEMDTSVLECNYCTHLEWSPPTTSCSTPLCMLAAAFINGLVVFHVPPSHSKSLTKKRESHDCSEQHGTSTNNDGLPGKLQMVDKNTIPLFPIAVTKASLTALRSNADKQQVTPVRTNVAWVNLGPRFPPSLALLFLSIDSVRNESSCRLVLGILRLPLYASSREKITYLPITQEEFLTPTCDVSSLSVALIGSSKFPFIPCSISQKIFLFSPLLKTLCKTQAEVESGGKTGRVASLKRGNHLSDPYFSAQYRPVSSHPFGGLDSRGAVLREGRKVVWIFSQLFCSRHTYQSISNKTSPGIDGADWGLPMQRHWLCYGTFESKHGSNATVGATTSVLCELTCGENSNSGLIPIRLCLDESCSFAVVLYSQMIFRFEDYFNPDCVTFALVPLSSTNYNDSMKLRQGRDAIFLPPKCNSGPDDAFKLIVIGRDGTSLYCLTKHRDSILWHEDGSVRLDLQDHRNDESYIEARRIFVVSTESVKLAFMGSSNYDGLSCVFFGQTIDFNYSSGEMLSRMLPLKGCQALWLEKGEEVVSLVNLPSEKSTETNLLALSTQFRVLIIDCSLQIISQVSTSVSCDALMPIGSRCVCFCSSADYRGLSLSKIRYLCCLSEPYAVGVVATLDEHNHRGALPLFLSIFPDRLHYLFIYQGYNLCEKAKNRDSFLVANAATKPALLLEPLVANALCLCDDPLAIAAESDEVQITLRTVIDRFGRRLSNLPYTDDQGIGVQGTGLTTKVYQMLNAHRCFDASSILLATKDSPSGIFPRWIPTWIKAKCSSNIDELKKVMVHGNRFLSDYLNDPLIGSHISLIDAYDPTSILCHFLGIDALLNGEGSNALALLDLASNEQSEQLITGLVLSSQLYSSKPVNPLRTLSGNGSLKALESTECKSASSIISAVALALIHRDEKDNSTIENGCFQKTSDATSRHLTYHLAPLVQDARLARRARNTLLSKHDIPLVQSKERPSKNLWLLPLMDVNNVWCHGPSGNKEELLLLDSIEDWIGMCRPNILGKEGAAAAKESGMTVLSGILAAAASPEKEKWEDVDSTPTNGWRAGVGEGRSDEENIGAYYRFSEGGDEDQRWLLDGIQDLSPYKNIGKILGTEKIALETTTTSVDEGEEGKVSILYDLVYTGSCDRDGIAGLVVDAERGSSLDVGILHSHEHEPRQRCSIEFWFHCPPSNHVKHEVVLVRRSIVIGREISAQCCPARTEGLLWELVVLPTGHLQFRNYNGSLLSTSKILPDLTSTKSEDESCADPGSVSFQRADGSGGWNHVCLVLSCRGQPSIADVAVRIVLKGKTVACGNAKIISPFFPSLENVNESLQNTALFFGLGGVFGFRMSEIRVWNCERKDDDIKATMYEYLSAAEIKPKFKVRIRRLGENVRRPLAAHKSGAIAPLPTRKTVILENVAAPPALKSKGETAGHSQDKRRVLNDDNYTTAIEHGNNEHQPGLISGGGSGNTETADSPPKSPRFTADSLAASPDSKLDSSLSYSLTVKEIKGAEASDSDDDSCQSLIFEESRLLSHEVRGGSIAAALIRGPVASRHFGGNRGGISSSKRCGIPSISICGTEKTILYTYGQKAPTKTYAISASGAITSEALDSISCQLLCCFLAKEKKLIVYDLNNKVMLVELTMTTKLNFWRSLPEESHGNTAVFLLITPIGGFHWMPLDVDPSPRLVWKRSQEFQGKRFLLYEEGGSNGLAGTLSRSTVALTLLCTSTSPSSEHVSDLEAWCIPFQSGSLPICYGPNVICAALCKPPNLGRKGKAFVPYVCLLYRWYEDAGVPKRAVLCVESLSQRILGKTESVSRGVQLAQTEIIFDDSSDFPEPYLAIGTAPEALLLSYEDAIVVLLRKQGLIYVYGFDNNELTLIGKKLVEHYIVDASLVAGELHGEIEIVLLLCNPSNTRDGRIAVCQVSRYGYVL